MAPKSRIQGQDECVKQVETLPGLGHKSHGGRFGCLSKTKVLLIFVGRKNDSLRHRQAP